MTTSLLTQSAERCADLLGEEWVDLGRVGRAAAAQSLVETLTRRAQALDDMARQILAATAVVGHQFDWRLLAVWLTSQYGDAAPLTGRCFQHRAITDRSLWRPSSSLSWSPGTIYLLDPAAVARPLGAH